MWRVFRSRSSSGFVVVVMARSSLSSPVYHKSRRVGRVLRGPRGARVGLVKLGPPYGYSSLANFDRYRHDHRRRAVGALDQLDLLDLLLLLRLDAQIADLPAPEVERVLRSR